MSWNILVFESARGERPVEEFIKSQQLKTQAKISQLIDLLEKQGQLLQMPYAKKNN